DEAARLLPQELRGIILRVAQVEDGQASRQVLKELRRNYSQRKGVAPSEAAGKEHRRRSHRPHGVRMRNEAGGLHDGGEAGSSDFLADLFRKLAHKTDAWKLGLAASREFLEGAPERPKALLAWVIRPHVREGRALWTLPHRSVEVVSVRNQRDLSSPPLAPHFGQGGRRNDDLSGLPPNRCFETHGSPAVRMIGR